MNSFDEIKNFLREYDGPKVRLMEVCGTHTASIASNGIPSMLSDNIRLISGPGCPVCVTVTAYIDKLVELAMNPDNTIVSFGDLLRVRGSAKSLSDAKAEGADVRMVYSPSQILDMAAADKTRTYIFAAVGFETTAPVYALLLEEAERRNISNVKLLTSLKTMPEVIRWVIGSRTDETPIDGFLAPGHVCAVMGADMFRDIAAESSIPFMVSGFEGPQILASIYELVKLRGKGVVENLYQTVVTPEGNLKAQKMMDRYFEPCDASWRGMGKITGSGLILRAQYRARDAGSDGLDVDAAGNGCRCASVLTGAISPTGCPLFGKTCTPRDPHGACMVSQEGSCYNWFISGRTR